MSPALGIDAMGSCVPLQSIDGAKLPASFREAITMGRNNRISYIRSIADPKKQSMFDYILLDVSQDREMQKLMSQSVDSLNAAVREITNAVPDDSMKDKITRTLGEVCERGDKGELVQFLLKLKSGQLLLEINSSEIETDEEESDVD